MRKVYSSLLWCQTIKKCKNYIIIGTSILCKSKLRLNYLLIKKVFILIKITYCFKNIYLVNSTISLRLSTKKNELWQPLLKKNNNINTSNSKQQTKQSLTKTSPLQRITQLTTTMIDNHSESLFRAYIQNTWFVTNTKLYHLFSFCSHLPSYL